MANKYYWELRYGKFPEPVKSLMIPPASAENVKKRWDNGQPIHTSNGSVQASEIKSFEPTDKLFTTHPLLEEVARAFNEPMINEDGEVKSRWVKKNVTQDKWNRFFSVSPGYKLLGESFGMMTIAFRVPVHLIDVNKTTPCTLEEVNRLTKL